MLRLIGAGTFQAGTPGDGIVNTQLSGLAFPNRNYDITPNGKQLLIQVPDPTNLRSREVDVVLNWFEELKRRVEATRADAVSHSAL